MHDTSTRKRSYNTPRSTCKEQGKVQNEIKMIEMKFIRYDTEIGDLDVTPLAATLGGGLLDKE